MNEFYKDRIGLPYDMSTATTCTTGGEPSFTLADLVQAAEKLKRSDTLAQHMREKGFDPDLGGRLILPKTDEYIRMLGDFPPYYVRFSIYTEEPLMANDPCAAPEKSDPPTFRWLGLLF